MSNLTPHDDKWIKVEDGLPPTHPEPHHLVEVIVYVPKLDKDTVHENGVTFGSYHPGLNTWRIQFSPSEWNVTHWQPKPQPPIQ